MSYALCSRVICWTVVPGGAWNPKKMRRRSIVLATTLTVERWFKHWKRRQLGLSWFVWKFQLVYHGLSWFIMVYHDKIVPFPNSTGLSWWIKSSPVAMAIDIIDWGVPVFRHSWSSLRMVFQLGWASWERNADIHSRSLFLWCLFKSHVINLADQLILGCTPHRHVLNWVEKLGFLDLSLKLGRGRAGTSFVVDISKVVRQFAPLFCIMLHLCSKLCVCQTSPRYEFTFSADSDVATKIEPLLERWENGLVFVWAVNCVNPLICRF